MRVKRKEPRKLRPERSKTDHVHYNATVQRPTGEGNEKLESPFDSLPFVAFFDCSQASVQCDENSLAAELKSVHWLEVFGRIDTAALTPETLYEVVFVEKIKENADGLESIFLRLIIPNKSSNEVTVNLMNVTETEKLNCKHGLVIKGIVIRPKA
ncbi:putative phosphatase IMPL1, chloroplastic-like isoform 1 [Capsicum annuum]|nr:putative phosphatase IMPL1, chloroplastic-like isoform 1 [Capsicum annuum]